MVARQKNIPFGISEASETPGSESESQRVKWVISPHTLWPPSSPSPQPEVEHSYSSQEPPHVPVSGSRSVNNQSPSMDQSSGLDHSLAGDTAMPSRQVDDKDMPLRPERTKRGFAEDLKPISRKKNLRAVARYKRDAPMLVCVETIRRAKAISGLSTTDIAELIGVSRPTVAAALRVDPSTNLYTFAEVLNVIGLELAEVAPMRKKQVVNGPRWQRGSFHSTANMARDIAQIEENKRTRRRRGNWE